MKRIIIASLILMMSVGTAWALESLDGTELKGEHFTLNIIGVFNPKNVNMDKPGGSVIFVWLDGLSKINLVEGPDYAVLDKNATDCDPEGDKDEEGGALLQLPDPGLDPYVVGEKKNPPGSDKDADTNSDYSVFVRPLGKPDGYATITTCADVLEGDLAVWLDKADIKILNRAGAFGGYASIEQVGEDITLRPRGKSTFVNVTAELLTIVLRIEIYDENGVLVDTIYVRIPIFDVMLENEYWEYDNEGLKHLQVRFYPLGTDVSAGDEDLPPHPE